ncbi:chemotaxis signal transduction system protein F [Haloarcula quadrata]|uniref:Chemotaxis signal transduction system protein F n=1 Tax=Haloarcula quadrata TaxID=182779 RepID=A0A495R3S0_9EURY|nr:CheF family chemotaxis protein [Haloarcula quadrata]RKS81892.1 chemotaxis signal transduction system protein F [Haloarcula quadrata]
MTRTVELSTTVFCPSVSAEPSQAQFRLNNAGVVVEGDQLAEEAGLDEIFDIRLGQPPRAAVETLSGTVLTIGFERGGQRVALFIGGSESTLDRVSGLLFRQLLDGTEVAVCHPATIGGRVTDRRFEIGELRVTPGKVGCTGIRQPLNVDLETIVGVSRSKKELLGRRELAVDLRYVRQGVVVGVDLSLNPPRKLNLLGRYLRRSYGGLRQELRELAPPPPVVRTLTRLYTHGGRTDSKSVLSQESADPAALLEELIENDLVTLEDGEVRLEMLGWVLVAEQAVSGWDS